MSWDEMCKGAVTTGQSVDVNALCGANADANRLTRAGLPSGATLAKMIAKAQGLDLGTARQGIWFNIISCGVKRGELLTAPLFNKAVVAKAGAAVCFENRFLPLKEAKAGTNLLVHQGVAPCKRCRTGYKSWAEELDSTIIVAADDGYDGAPDNSVFVFAPSGDVFYV